MYCSSSSISSSSNTSGWLSFLLVCYILIITLRCTCLSLFSSKRYDRRHHRPGVARSPRTLHCLRKEHQTHGQKKKHTRTGCKQLFSTTGAKHQPIEEMWMENTPDDAHNQRILNKTKNSSKLKPNADFDFFCSFSFGCRRNSCSFCFIFAVRGWQTRFFGSVLGWNMKMWQKLQKPKETLQTSGESEEGTHTRAHRPIKLKSKQFLCVYVCVWFDTFLLSMPSTTKMAEFHFLIGRLALLTKKERHRREYYCATECFVIFSVSHLKRETNWNNFHVLGADEDLLRGQINK